MVPRDRGIGDSPFVAVAVAALLVTAGVGAFFHGGPLLYYDARPAYVTDSGLSSTEYRAINTTDFDLSVSPIPFVSVSARTWVSVYATGIEPATAEKNATVDVRNGTLTGVFSMSALQLGPVSFNPVVYGSHPRVLAATGVLIDRAEEYLPQNVTEVTDLSIRGDREVTVLGQQETMTTFTGTLVLSDDTTIDVRLYIVRAVRNGELVVVFGIAPASAEGSADSFATLAENVQFGAWGEDPPRPGTADVQSSASLGPKPVSP